MECLLQDSHHFSTNSDWTASFGLHHSTISMEAKRDYLDLAIFERGNNIEPMPVKPKNPSKSMFAEKEKMQL